MLLEEIALIVMEPLVLCEPDHAPEAKQLVALVEFHVSTELLPLVTEDGLAEIVTIGADATATVADVFVVPPAPVQLSVNVLVDASVPVDCDPAVDLDPLHAPEAVQLVAFVVLHVRVELLPLETDVGLAEMLMVGIDVAGVTLTVADRAIEPLLFLHVSVNVLLALSAPVDVDPLSA